MNITLYEITQDYRRAIAQLADEPDQQKAADILESIGGALQDKAVNVALYIAELRAAEAAIEAECKRLNAMADAIIARRTTLLKRIDEAMLAAGITEISSPLTKIKRAKNPPSVEVLDEKQIPPMYFVQPDPPAPRLDKRALLADLKNGAQIDGARLQQGTRLVIE